MTHCKSLGQARLIFNNEIPIILLRACCFKNIAVMMSIKSFQKERNINKRIKILAMVSSMKIQLKPTAGILTSIKLWCIASYCVLKGEIGVKKLFPNHKSCVCVRNQSECWISMNYFKIKQPL